ncbi:Serine/threonine-protein kinase PAK 4 [Chelonia mydas]|uniref:non-specific serine/threonine protein kinase n=1 Tax=Chelonia mydas TaxID=8469 RepID=M7B6P5_CHEMY|nr:Serine/threonine-protein kinase PAK 4 [Chelonia mydas]
MISEYREASGLISSRGLLANRTMFSKKKKRVEISAPSNFEHRVHTGYDQQEQKFTGLPRQWQGIIEESAKRPKPLVDPVFITAIQHGSQKYRCVTFRILFVYTLGNGYDNWLLAETSHATLGSSQPRSLGLSTLNHEAAVNNAVVEPLRTLLKSRAALRTALGLAALSPSEGLKTDACSRLARRTLCLREAESQ